MRKISLLSIHNLNLLLDNLPEDSIISGMDNALSPDFDLLSLLKRQENPALPTDIVEALGISHNELLSKLDVLDAIGYQIEFHPYLGVRLLDVPDRLLDYEIKDGLNAKVIGKNLNIFDSIPSTNDEAWRAIETRKVVDGECFLAESQTNARGRMGRSWHAPEGVAIYLSFVAKLKLPPERVGFLTSSIALAIANTIQQFVHLPAEIKWPNDVLIGGKKVAGVLVESRSNIPDTYVVGIGLNVNHREADFPESLREIASSLRLCRKGKPMHRIRLLRPLLFYLDSVYNQLRRKKYERIGRAWSEFVTIVGERAVLRAKGEDVEGRILSLDLEEGVSLELDDGMVRSYRPEHVTTIQALSAPAVDSE